MTTRKNTGRLVAELRKLIHKSQTQFAAMIGVSKHTVISVENGRNQLSRKLANRIYTATGADLALDNPESAFQVGKYTSNDFDHWRKKYFPSNEESARKRYDEMKVWLKIILLAAAKPGLAGNSNRLPAVCLSFTEWLDETRKQFKLEDQIEDILPDETRDLGRASYKISGLLENPKKAKETLAEHDIDFNAIKKQLQQRVADGFLIVEDEYRSTWSPPSMYGVLVVTRKLIPQAKCWIRTFKSDATSLSEFSRLVRPLEPGEAMLIPLKTTKKIS